VFAQQDGTTVAQSDQIAVLMSRVGLSDRLGSWENQIASEVGGRFRVGKSLRI
jgi:hypothetical protein